MNLPRVIVDDSYADFLNGKEVRAMVVSSKDTITKGTRVMGFHNSIAINTNIPAPREKQAHYVGVEGLVIDVPEAGSSHVIIRKL